MVGGEEVTQTGKKSGKKKSKRDYTRGKRASERARKCEGNEVGCVR